jgi:hypothetical protein
VSLVPDLAFSVQEVVATEFAAVPTLAFKLRIVNSVAGEAVHTVALRCQIQIEASRRRYTPEEQRNIVPSFKSETLVDLPVTCTFDFNVAATKYFAGLKGGEIPLRLQFSGTVFYAGYEGELQVAPISWEQEATFRLPQATWQQMMDSYYPNSAWMSLRRDVFERLRQYKTQHGIPTWEQVLESVLPVEETVGS